MIKYQKITDNSLVIDIRYRYIEKTILSKVPIWYRYRYIDIGDISTIYSIYWPTST